MALLGGNQASITWAGSGGSPVTLDVNEGFQWEGEFVFKEEETTPFGYASVRRTAFLNDAQGTLSFNVTDVARPPIPLVPNGYGQLALKENSGQKFTINVLLTRMTSAANSVTARVQRVQYEWKMSATSTSDSIT